MRLKHVKGANETIIKGKYYVEDPKSYKGKWNEIFNNNNPIHIEIGMGKGKFITENAIENPNINFIGIEKYDSVMVRAIERTNELEVPNLRLVRIDARIIEEIFDKEIDTIYLNFSDPWPKDRHSKRRLSSINFLQKYDNIFKSKKTIILKTDNIGLFNFSISELIDYNYNIIYRTNDLHNEKIPNITTEYEEKFTNLGIKINKLVAIK